MQLHRGKGGTVAATANSDHVWQLLEGEGQRRMREEPVSSREPPQPYSHSHLGADSQRIFYYYIQDLDTCYTCLNMCQMSLFQAICSYPDK